jgi:hypothetical protein
MEIKTKVKINPKTKGFIIFVDKETTQALNIIDGSEITVNISVGGDANAQSFQA